MQNHKSWSTDAADFSCRPHNSLEKSAAMYEFSQQIAPDRFRIAPDRFKILLLQRGKSGELCMLPARNAYCADHIAVSNAIVRPIRSRHDFRLYQGPIERVRAERQGGRQKSG